MDKDKDYTMGYKMDLDDIKQIIQEETKFYVSSQYPVKEGWIPDSKEDRRNLIEWGLKVLQIDALLDIGNALSDIRSAIYDVNEETTYQ